MNKPRVAILGLGIMGTGMARRVLGAGFPLTVFNRTKEKAKTLASEGSRIASSPREAAENSGIVISMVADDVASRAMWIGDNGALAGAAPGSILIESSTLTVKWIKELATLATAKQCEFLDAPVTGTKPQAAAGQLNFIVGGAEATLTKAKPVLDVMSQSITHLGPAGSGAMVKLINNFLCGVQCASLAQAIAFIEKTGLKREQALAIITEGAPGSPLVKTLAKRMTTPDFTPNFMLRLASKDLKYAMFEAGQVNLQLTMASAAMQQFQQAEAAGLDEKDLSAVVELLRKT
ncbi:MAG TPA: NAD(P)-dependent oxidoreductase [Tepidisphaeraceae bacterium]|nr:NAD(P)-dependent oxidoreductase [Tepidisphaeraceae bacterium]